MRHSALAAAVLTFSLCTGGVTAQCAPVTFTPYGASCGDGFPGATLTGFFDAGTCTFTLDISANPGCCNSFAQAKIFALGFQQAAIPIPGMPQPCFLLTTLDLIVVTPAAQDGPSFPVIPQVQGLTIYAQGLVSYTQTLGGPATLSFTQGLQIGF